MSSGLVIFLAMPVCRKVFHQILSASGVWHCGGLGFGLCFSDFCCFGAPCLSWSLWCVFGTAGCGQFSFHAGKRHNDSQLSAALCVFKALTWLYSLPPETTALGCQWTWIKARCAFHARKAMTMMGCDNEGFVLKANAGWNFAEWHAAVCTSDYTWNLSSFSHCKRTVVWPLAMCRNMAMFGHFHKIWTTCWILLFFVPRVHFYQGIFNHFIVTNFMRIRCVLSSLLPPIRPGIEWFSALTRCCVIQGINGNIY